MFPDFVMGCVLTGIPGDFLDVDDGSWSMTGVVDGVVEVVLFVIVAPLVGALDEGQGIRSGKATLGP